MLFQDRYHDGLSPSELNVTGILHFRQGYVHRRLFPWHCHAHYELHYFHDPLPPSVEGKSCELRLYGPFQPHTMDSTGYARCMMLQFPHAFLRRAIPDLPENGVILLRDRVNIQPGDEIDRALHHTGSLLMTTHEHMDWLDFNHKAKSYYTTEKQMLLNGSLLSLLGLLLQKNAAVISASSINLKESPMRDLLLRMMGENRLLPSMADAAKSTHMSYSAFSRAFHTTVGCSYPDFCNMVRVSQAEELLRFASLNSTQIAQQLNFGSTSYFNRVFRRLTGLTPTDYRQKHTEIYIQAK